MSTKLFVGNLSYEVTSEELDDLFSQVGEVVSSYIVTDRITGRSRGFGFVEMVSAELAQAAIEQLHGQEFRGRNLVVNEAKPRPDRPRGGPDPYRPGGGRGRGGGGRRRSSRPPRW
ncbi:MAG: RNA-binding protein [Acidobacteria bacterium]|nr:MAG: RNA-binding protein [Acidobacteriota bacterium]